MKINFKKFFENRISSWVILSAFMILVILFLGSRQGQLTAFSLGREGRLRAVFFDVGQGDAELLMMPDGSDILIDGGPDGKVSEFLGEILPPSDRKIELMVLTHPHADHLAGLVNVLKHYAVDKIMMTDVKIKTYTENEWLRQIENFNIPVIFPNKGDRFNYGGASLEVFSPDRSNKRSSRPAVNGDSEINDASIVLSVNYGQDSILLMGDAGEEIEKRLLPLLSERVDILKVGHHGSKYSSEADFIKKISPQYAIISSGAGNKYGHPSYKTIRTLERSGATVFRTDTDGSVYAESEGRGFSLKTENGSRVSCQNMFFILRLFLRCR